MGLAWGVDYSWARPNPQAMYAAGIRVVFRYLSRDASKDLWTPEYQALKGAGLDVIANWETAKDRALAGYQAGFGDATAANLHADTIGYPLDYPIYYSVDIRADWQQVADYFRGVKDAGRRARGIYGGTLVGHPALDSGFVTKFWLANAGSWSGVGDWRYADRSRAHVVQHLDHPISVAGTPDNQLDIDEIFRADYATGEHNVPLTPQDIQLVAAAVDAKLNRVIGTLQTNLRDEQAALLGAIAHSQQGGLDPVALAKAIADQVNAAEAKAVADELYRRLQS